MQLCPLGSTLGCCALAERLRAVQASLLMESALCDRRIAVRRRFDIPRWRPQLVRPSAGIVCTAWPPVRPLCPLSLPEVPEESQAFNNLNGRSPEHGNGPSGLAPAGPAPGWAAQQQGGPSRRCSRRIDSHGAAVGFSVLGGAVSAASHPSGPAGVRAPAPGLRLPGAAHPGHADPETGVGRGRLTILGITAVSGP
ncbi:hypothetical protein NDU88_002123 [Pleurodeles waltl]|uniref:Uncharacterized protein n=1 Tax=Pleurodeles waltl TaxID=8319 RepID=A0AAV7M530_PLEWA|nr:hypothetical protein NDU88_002123 [Pleurodeles waltl]